MLIELNFLEGRKRLGGQHKLNFWPMMLWAWLIALFIAFGIAVAFLGLIIVLPIIGHATWHAYTDLVAHPRPAGCGRVAWPRSTVCRAGSHTSAGSGSRNGQLNDAGTNRRKTRRSGSKSRMAASTLFRL